jgi:hypothetical protein
LVPEGQPKRRLPVNFTLIEVMIARHLINAKLKSAGEPSEFEVIFVNDDVRYQYGFAATAAQLNSTSLAAVFAWFADTLHILGADDLPDTFTARQCQDVHAKSDVLAFLQAADIAIADLRVQVEQLSEEHLRDEVSPERKSII